MAESTLHLPGVLEGRELAALVHASAAIGGTLDLDVMLRAIAEHAADVLDAEASSVLLHEKRRRKLVFAAAVGASADSLLGQEMSPTEGIAGRVMRSGAALLVPDVRQHPDFFKGFDEQSDFVTRGLIAAPLIARDEVVGVVEVLNRRGGRPFETRDADLLQVFANLAASSVLNAQQHDVVKRENRGFRASLEERPVVGESAALQQVFSLCERVSHTSATVLLLGETGTGKEVTAQLVHRKSPRAHRPFVAINCAALTESLLESELFGHEAGAFTGANTQKLGRFELADGGTLFLDEIGDISMPTQIKLLRVLQEREFVRVGGVQPIACDVRIIAATNRDLKAAINEGTFREDLYYRLNVFPIQIPPLRERSDDVGPLVTYYVERASAEMLGRVRRVSPDALALLTAYRWPGNIRELRNVVERAVLLCDGEEIQPAQLPPEIVNTAGADQAHPAADPRPRSAPTEARPPTSAAAAPIRDGSAAASVEAYERTLIIKALEDHGWNQTHAARALSMTRDNLRYRMKKYNIRRP